MNKIIAIRIWELNRNIKTFLVWCKNFIAVFKSIDKKRNHISYEFTTSTKKLKIVIKNIIFVSKKATNKENSMIPGSREQTYQAISITNINFIHFHSALSTVIANTRNSMCFSVALA